VRSRRGGGPLDDPLSSRVRSMLYAWATARTCEYDISFTAPTLRSPETSTLACTGGSTCWIIRSARPAAFSSKTSGDSTALTARSTRPADRDRLSPRPRGRVARAGPRSRRRATREKSVDHLALGGEVGVGDRVRALDAAARAAGELAGRLGRAVDHRPDRRRGRRRCRAGRTRAARGDSVSSTTSSASPTESASSASCSGSIPSTRSRSARAYEPRASPAAAVPRAEHVQRDA
jgi:hypothetical protein